MNSNSDNKTLFIIALLASTILLSIAATYAQVDYLGLHFIKVQQAKMHQQMLAGTAGNPWQYRILADLVVEQVIVLLTKVGIAHAESASFVAFRFLQNLLILAAAGVYYRKLGLPLYPNLIGLSLLAWGMSHSLYNSDLSFNVYFDVAFYLLAAILILDGRFIWLILLMIPAAFNRETSILMPFMLAGLYYFDAARKNSRRRAMISAVAGLVLFSVIFIGLRLHYGRQEFLTADGYYPGLELLYLNVRRGVTWEQLLITLGIVPLLAVFAYRNWPQSLRVFFWVVVPAWFTVHFLVALVAETRLLLVPQALIFIPGALFGMPFGSNAQENSFKPDSSPKG